MWCRESGSGFAELSPHVGPTAGCRGCLWAARSANQRAGRACPAPGLCLHCRGEAAWGQGERGFRGHKKWLDSCVKGCWFQRDLVLTREILSCDTVLWGPRTVPPPWVPQTQLPRVRGGSDCDPGPLTTGWSAALTSWRLIVSFSQRKRLCHLCLLGMAIALRRLGLLKNKHFNSNSVIKA